MPPAGCSKSHSDQHACPYPPCNTHHHKVPFHDRFELFCEEPKNRDITNQNSNERSSIQHPFSPLYQSTLQPSRSPLFSCVKHRIVRRRFRGEMRAFCREPKNRFIVLRTSNARISTKGRFAPFCHGTQQQPRSSLLPCNAQQRVTPFQLSFYPFRSPKIDTFIYKLRATLTSLVDIVRPSIIVHDDSHARPYSMCKAQHRAAQFRPIFHGAQKSRFS